MSQEAEIVISLSGGTVEKVCCTNGIPVRVVVANYDDVGDDADGFVTIEKDGTRILLDEREIEYESRFADHLIELI